MYLVIRFRAGATVFEIWLQMLLAGINCAERKSNLRSAVRDEIVFPSNTGSPDCKGSKFSTNLNCQGKDITTMAAREHPIQRNFGWYLWNNPPQYNLTLRRKGHMCCPHRRSPTEYNRISCWTEGSSLCLLPLHRFSLEPVFGPHILTSTGRLNF